VVREDNMRSDEDAVFEANALEQRGVVLDLHVVTDMHIDVDKGVAAERAVASDLCPRSDLDVGPHATPGADLGPRLDDRSRMYVGRISVANGRRAVSGRRGHAGRRALEPAIRSAVD